MTQQEIRLTGIEILRQHFSKTDMIRFLQQTETGRGNYTKTRESLLENLSLKDLVSDIQKSGLNTAIPSKKK